MKKFTKMFLSCAALTTVTAALATSAMAADITGNLTGTYDETTGKVSIAAPEDMDATQDATFVVFPKTADDTALKDEDIVGIDQLEGKADADKTKPVAFEKNGLKGTPKEADGEEYIVKLGYYNTDGAFVTKDGKLFSKGVEILVGDVVVDTKIGTDDASAVLQHIVKKDLTGVALEAAKQSNKLGDTVVGTDDASEILTYIVKKTSDSVNHTVTVDIAE